MSEPLDLGALAREIGLPPPSVHQGRAARWLEGQLGAVRCRGGRSQIDLFDALRSQMILQGGIALAHLALARAAVARAGDRTPPLIGDFGEVTVAELIARVVAPGRSPSVGARRGPGRRGLEALYRAKRALARRLARWSPRDSTVAGPTDLLAIPRHPDHLSDLLPVARRLREGHGLSTRFAVVDEESAERVRREGHPVVRLHALGRVRRRTAAALVGEVDAHLAGGAGGATGTARAQSAEGAEFDPGERAALALAAGRVVRTNVADLVRVQAAVEALLATAPPRAVVVGNPYTFEGRTAALVARAHGVPAAAIEHGSIGPRDPRWARCPVDLVCAWGEPSRDALLTCGLAPGSVAVTGAPRLDEVLAAGSRPDSAARPGEPYLLVATSGAGDSVSLAEHLDFIARLYRAAESCRLPFVVKLHAKDAAGLYREAARRHPDAAVEIHEASRRRTGLEIFDYLRRARALVTVTSTSAVDAMAVGVPVVAVAPEATGPFPDLSYLSAEIVLRARTADDLAAAAVRAWEGAFPAALSAAARAYADRHFAHRGRASEEAAGRIADLATGRDASHLAPTSATAVPDAGARAEAAGARR